MKKNKQKELDNDFLDNLPANKVLNNITSPFANKLKTKYQAKHKGWKDTKKH